MSELQAAQGCVRRSENKNQAESSFESKLERKLVAVGELETKASLDRSHVKLGSLEASKQHETTTALARELIDSYCGVHRELLDKERHLVAVRAALAKLQKHAAASNRPDAHETEYLLVCVTRAVSALEPGHVDEFREHAHIRAQLEEEFGLLPAPGSFAKSNLRKMAVIALSYMAGFLTGSLFTTPAAPS